MTTLPFVDTHNLVAFLDKLAKSEGFEQIVDFLMASSIRYALTVNPIIYTLCIQQFWATFKVKTDNGEKHKPRKLKKKDTQIPQSSVPSDNIADEAINEENVPTHSNDPLLSGEDRLKLEEMMALCTNLQNRVLDLEHTKTTQALEIDRLKRRVKKLEKKQRSRTYELRRLYKGRKIHDIDADEDITLDSTHFDTDLDMFGVHDLDMFGVHNFDTDFDTEEPVVNASTTASTILVSVAKYLSDVDMTLAQALAELKNAKPKTVTTAATTTTTDVTRTKAKGLAIQEQEQASSSKDKGKGIMVEEPLKMKKKDQVLFDEQEAIRLQAQFDEEARIVREKEEANAALIAQCNDIQDKKRRKHFVAKREEERRNRPPTKAQQRSIMCTYLKNMAGWKPKDLKTKSFANVQELFDKAMKRVNISVDMDTELVGGSEVRAEGSKTIAQESSLKRAGDELEQDKSKKQKLDEKVEVEVDDAKEAEELKQCLEVVPDDEDDVTIDATPLSVKIAIVDYKIYQEGKKSFFQIIRADGKTQMYLTFTKILKNFDREDLEVLWRIVKARFKKTEPVNYMDTFLHLNLKTLFEHHVEDSIWKNQQGLVEVLNWIFFILCGVHYVTRRPHHTLSIGLKECTHITKHYITSDFDDGEALSVIECEMALTS
ncbi:hypothetical protein Tco_1091495 [Tanacetum coccineum]|uniref:Uncharacterized protein n=1 Tax=Tanacetum coccineum TaxID=301880 RepID=A0ABQ5I9J5_9ASTR